MRIFRQAIQQLGGSAQRGKSDPRHFDDPDIRVTPPEKYFQASLAPQPLGRQFFTQLSHLELKLASEYSTEKLNQVIGMYQMCVEFYDSKKDDIKYYFVEKIQNAMCDIKKFQKLKTTIEEPTQPKIELSPSPIAKIDDDDNYFRNKKRQKSVLLTIQQKVCTEAQLNGSFVGDLVTQFHETVDKQTTIMQQQADQQDVNFKERLRKRSMSRKSLSRFQSVGSIPDRFLSDI